MIDVTAMTTEHTTRIHYADGTHKDGEPTDREIAEMVRDGINMAENADFQARKGVDRAELVSRTVTRYDDGSTHLTAWSPAE